MLTAKQIEVAVKNFVSVCNEHLFFKGRMHRPLVDDTRALPGPEEDVAKAFSMWFKKTWWTEPHDVEVMCKLFLENLPDDVDEPSFLHAVVYGAYNKEKKNIDKWNENEYPFLCFDTDKDMSPYYMKIIEKN